MRRVFLFNPENDIALGTGLERITPPRQAALLHKAGAMLSFWLGESGDFVVVGEEELAGAERWMEEVAEILGVDGPRPVASLRGMDDVGLTPWGWSRDAVCQFEKLGAVSGILEEKRGGMDVRRDLSHRKSALRFLEIWETEVGKLPFTLPVQAFCPDDVKSFVEASGRCMVKSPWSSSGRGVFPVDASTLEASLSRIEGLMKRQGSVMLEPLLPKLQDFAMLFNYNGGESRFEGYSMFFNSTDTNYGGNYIGSDDMILARLEEWVSRREVETVREKVEEILPCVLGGGYEGPLGIDMMVCGDEAETPWIAPCVEINLRYTMGFVARGVWRKLGREGRMSISPAGGDWASGIREGERPVRLAPLNDWFDFMFHPYA